MYTQKIANSFDHIQDHSRLGLENKFLENKSRRIFLRSTGLLYKFLPTNLGVLNQPYINFIRRWAPVFIHHIWGEQYYLSYRPRTECSISQFFKTNIQHQSIFRMINRKAKPFKNFQNHPYGRVLRKLRPSKTKT